MKDFLTNFPFRELSIFVTFIGSFTYNVLLDRDMACTCTDVGSDYSLYMALPFFIIFLLILWTDKTLERICKYTCVCVCEKLKKEEPIVEPTEECTDMCTVKCLDECLANCTVKSKCYRYYMCRRELCGVFWTRLFKAVGVGLLWVASVLIDGDWYVCCQYDQSKNQSQLACKDKKNITAEENVAINTLKNTSKNIGFGVLLVIIFLAALMTLCDWRRRCHGKSCCCSRREVYDTVILEEGENVLDKVFREAAKEELFEMIFKKIKENENENENGGGEENVNGGGSGSGNRNRGRSIEENKWIECLDVASEMVEKRREPKLSKEQQKKLLQGPKQEQ